MHSAQRDTLLSTSPVARGADCSETVANYADVIGRGFQSAALIDRLQAAEAELERLRSAGKVVLDLHAVIAALPSAVRRYGAMVADLGNTPSTLLAVARSFAGS
jgi:hypothetical protein